MSTIVDRVSLRPDDSGGGRLNTPATRGSVGGCANQGTDGGCWHTHEVLVENGPSGFLLGWCISRNYSGTPSHSFFITLVGLAKYVYHNTG